MLGVKPFPGVKNSEVIGKLENGERLALPPGCPPRLYTILLQCWADEPRERPTFSHLKHVLASTLRDETDGGGSAGFTPKQRDLGVATGLHRVSSWGKLGNG